MNLIRWLPPRFRSGRLLRAVLLALAGIAAVFAWRLLVPPAVPVLRVLRQPLLQTVVASGRVRADARARLGAQVAGSVRRVLVREGDTVAAGSGLLQLDDRELRGAVAQARAGLLQAEANLLQVTQVRRPATAATLRQAQMALRNAELDLERAQELRANGSVSDQELETRRQAYEVARAQREIALAQAGAADTAGADVRAAEASVAAARAAVESAEARLAYTWVTAPGQGVVLTRAVEPGDAVQPGRVLMELALEAPAMLSVVPDERNLSRLQVGQPALATADAFPADPFRATVRYVSPVVDPAQGTVEVRLTVDSAPPYLRPDMTVSVNIEVARRADAIVVPLEAVHDPLSPSPWVHVVRDGRAVRQPVRLGAQGPLLGEVLEGLREGEAVIPVAYRPVADDMRVRVRR